MIRHALTALFMVPLVLAMQCSSPVAGGSTTTDNAKVMAQALYPDGAPAKGALARLRTAAYLPSNGSDPEPHSQFETVTDDKGVLVFDSIPSGEYALEINDRDSSAALIRFVVNQNSPEIELGAKTLKKYASVIGSVDIPAANTSARACLEGLERSSPVRNDGTFAIDSIPEAMYQIRVLGSTPSDFIFTDSVMAKSGQAVQVSGFAQWSYAAEILVNTSASGARVSGNLYNVPVLIRLDSSNFDFALARDSGQDIRFVSAGNTALTFEIQQWDRTNQKAALWVLVDSIAGNTNVGAMLMLAGNAQVKSASDHRNLYSEYSSYTGVWNLDETDYHFADKSPGKLTGTGINITAPPADGVLGKACELDGIDDHISFGTTDKIGIGLQLSVAAWVKLASFPTGSSSRVIGMRDSRLQQSGFELRISSIGTEGKGSVSMCGSENGFCASDTVGVLSAGTWHYLVGTIDDNTGRVYIDGHDVTCFSGEVGVGAPVKELVATYAELIIGKGEQGFLNGSIDEVRIHSDTWSAEQVRFFYENQRIGSTMITVRRVR